MLERFVSSIFTMLHYAAYKLPRHATEFDRNMKEVMKKIELDTKARHRWIKMIIREEVDT